MRRPVDCLQRHRVSLCEGALVFVLLRYNPFELVVNTLRPAIQKGEAIHCRHAALDRTALRDSSAHGRLNPRGARVPKPRNQGGAPLRARSMEIGVQEMDGHDGHGTTSGPGTTMAWWNTVVPNPCINLFYLSILIKLER